MLEVAGSRLVAILHRGAPTATRGVVIVVGGPQYRAGSHRQFVLLARHLAAAGVPVLRFDYRGIGDSEGPYAGFESISDDIRGAIDTLIEVVPSLQEVILWGLCDGASGILQNAHKHDRVHGIVLLNPWVRTETGEARAYIKHYYFQRLLDKDFWKRIARGKFSPKESVSSFLAFGWRALRTKNAPSACPPTGTSAESLPERMASGFALFKGHVLIITSGHDLTAKEFLDLGAQSAVWRKLLSARRVTQQHLPHANHTFSRREWRDQVAQSTATWLKSW